MKYCKHCPSLPEPNRQLISSLARLSRLLSPRLLLLAIYIYFLIPITILNKQDLHYGEFRLKAERLSPLVGTLVIPFVSELNHPVAVSAQSSSHKELEGPTCVSFLSSLVLELMGCGF